MPVLCPTSRALNSCPDAQVVEGSTATQVEAAHHVEEVAYLLVSCEEGTLSGAAVPDDHVSVAMSYTSTALVSPVVPPATNTLPLKAPDAEP